MTAIDRAAEAMGAVLHKLNRHNMYRGRCDSCEADARYCAFEIKDLLRSDADQAVLNAAEAETAAEERWGQYGSPDAFKAKVNARRDRIAAVRARRDQL